MLEAPKVLYFAVQTQHFPEQTQNRIPTKNLQHEVELQSLRHAVAHLNLRPEEVQRERLAVSGFGIV